MEERANESGRNMRRMAGLTASRPGLAAAALGALLAELSCSLGAPPVLGRAVDELGRGGAATRWAAAFFALSAASNLLRYLHGNLRGRLVHALCADLRESALEKLHRLSPSYFADRDSGSLLARVSRDIDKMRPFFGDVLMTTVRIALVAGGSLAVMACYGPAMAAVTAGCLAASLAVTVGMAARLGPLNRRADDLYDAVSCDIKEGIEGVRVVKAFGRERLLTRRFDERVERYLEGALAASDLWSARMPVANALFGLATPAVLLVGGWEVAAGRLDKGAVVAALFYAARIFSEMGGMHRLAATAQDAAVSAGRLFELLDSGREVRETASPRRLPQGKGGLVFEGVGFGYPGGGRLLSGLSFEVRSGERVAVVGATGSGKSTLAALLVRFFDPEEGRILLDGEDLAQLGVAELRRAVACVFQESFLFAGTLRRNIAYARPDASEAEVLAALETARLGPVVAGLPDGLDTVVGERGVTLSGGQRQRVALARAVLAAPRLLVLDDATASLDGRTERELVGALAAASRGRTTLLITQRLSGVLLADRVVVLEDGRAADSGRHDELMGRCAAYRGLFAAQAEDAGSVGAGV